MGMRRGPRRAEALASTLGLLDRIAGTLEGLGRDAEAEADERANQEIAEAMTLAGAGDGHRVGDLLVGALVGLRLGVTS